MDSSTVLVADANPACTTVIALLFNGTISFQGPKQQFDMTNLGRQQNPIYFLLGMHRNSGWPQYSGNNF
jgi:hypothetical protein